MRADAPVQPAVAEHPLELVGEHEQRRHRRRVVGLVLAGVVERRGERQELGDPAVGRRRAPSTRSMRGGAQQREPQPAVGGEALLRREVVDVGLRRRRRGRPPAPEVASTSDERVAGVGGPHDGDHHAGRGLVVRPGEDVGAGSAGGRGRVAGLGLDDDRVAQERGAGGDRRELRGELAEASGAASARGRARTRRRPRTRSCRRCRARPRSRRAARTARAGRRGRGRRRP